MKKKLLYLIVIILMLCSCAQQSKQYRIVVSIPVYGQSLALGEEAERITDFDSLAAYANGRIITENMNHAFGYFENDELKQNIKNELLNCPSTIWRKSWLIIREAIRLSVFFLEGKGLQPSPISAKVLNPTKDLWKTSKQHTKRRQNAVGIS